MKSLTPYSSQSGNTLKPAKALQDNQWRREYLSWIKDADHAVGHPGTSDMKEFPGLVKQWRYP